MLETVSKEIIDQNTIFIHFIDEEIDGINTEQSEEIRKYKTEDDSEFLMALRVNAIPPSIRIDLKIKYSKNFYSPNFYDLMGLNIKRFQDFYNEIMNYNETMDYNELINSKESSKIRSSNP
jgi:hypothetical protein